MGCLYQHGEYIRRATRGKTNIEMEMLAGVRSCPCLDRSLVFEDGVEYSDIILSLL